VHGAEGREVHILYEKDCLTSDNESLTPLHDMMTSIAHYDDDTHVHTTTKQQQRTP
jgi:hypothetical protein